MHVIYQLKTSNDLELFELELPNKSKLEDVCDLRQPLLFNYDEENIRHFSLARLAEYNAFDVMVYDASYVSIPTRLETAIQLFETTGFSANNSDFLHETMAKRYYMNTDAYLRPPMVSSIHYDLLFGAIGATTRLEYSTHYRNYLYVSNGSVTIKLTPPRNTKYLNMAKDYGTQENYSHLNPWQNPIDKVKFLEITIPKGKMIFIPSYWWYSLKFEKEACVCSFKYKTIMNIIATLPDICIGVLQRQNTKVKIISAPVLPLSSILSHTLTAPDEPL
jgi:hypothetical protein